VVVLALSVLVAATLMPRPAHAQSQTQSPQKPAAPAPTAETPTAIPVAEITGRADEVSAYLRSIDEQLPPSSQISKIEQELGPLGDKLTERAEQTHRTIVAAPGLGTLDSLADSWQSSRLGLVSWMANVTDRANWLEQQRTQLAKLSATWAKTRAELRAAKVPPELTQRTADTVAAIAAKHQALELPAPTTPMVRAVIAGARRKHGGNIKRMAAITTKELAAVIAHVGEGRDQRDRSNRVARDRAALSLGFAGAFRRSDLVRLHLRDIDLRADRLQVTTRKSKTDQEGKGKVLVIPKAKNAGLCPVRMMAAWLRLRGNDPGPLFCDVTPAGELVKGKGMGVHSIRYALKTGADYAGIDHARFGSHSLRAGAVTAAADAGADVWEIMELTGHKSVETVGKYVRRSIPRYALAKVL